MSAKENDLEIRNVDVRVEDFLNHRTAGVRVPIGRLDARGLLEQRPLLLVRRYQLGTLPGILGRDVPRDGARFVQHEAVVVLIESYHQLISRERKKVTDDVGDLTKRLLGHVFRSLVLALLQVDGVELEGHIFLVQNESNALATSRVRETVEFENHREGCWMMKDKYSVYWLLTYPFVELIPFEVSIITLSYSLA